MGRILAWAGAILAGLAIGAVSAFIAVGAGQAAAREPFGAWSYSRAAGAASPGVAHRAVIAREGLLALSAREAITFTLESDADGRELQEGCIYDLEGARLPARWWSLTLYGSDAQLVSNNDHAYALDASRIEAQSNGRWRARIAPVRGSAVNWLSSRGAGRGFSLTLRAYHANRGVETVAAALPELHVVSCPERG